MKKPCPKPSRAEVEEAIASMPDKNLKTSATRRFQVPIPDVRLDSKPGREMAERRENEALRVKPSDCVAAVRLNKGGLSWRVVERVLHISWANGMNAWRAGERGKLIIAKQRRAARAVTA